MFQNTNHVAELAEAVEMESLDLKERGSEGTGQADTVRTPSERNYADTNLEISLRVKVCVIETPDVLHSVKYYNYNTFSRMTTSLKNYCNWRRIWRIEREMKAN